MSRYVFGPISSRRLGRSLGVDLVKAKTCSLDCVYCEVGATRTLTLERSEAVPVDDVLAELREVLSKAPELDFVTFSGAGEPTLNSRIGDVIRFLKQEFPQYRTCLLTNACGFTDPALRREVAGTDVVVPSLDASNEAEFQQINRPVPGLHFPEFLAGLQAFCCESTAEIDLELFLVPGVNDSAEAAARFAEIMKTLRVRKVQLNTLDRPGTESWVRPASPEAVKRFMDALSPVVPVEAVGRCKAAAPEDCVRTGLVCRILETAAKQPVSAAELVQITEAEPAVVQANLDRLVQAGLLTGEQGLYSARR